MFSDDEMQAVVRLQKRASEIETLSKQYESWEIGEARQHAKDIRLIIERLNCER